jgi:hypothetical protein
VLDAAANEVVLTDQNGRDMRAVLLGERAEWLAIHNFLIHGLCIPPDGHHCTFENTGAAWLHVPAEEPPGCDTPFWGRPVRLEPSFAATDLTAPRFLQNGHAIEVGFRVLRMGLIG